MPSINWQALRVSSNTRWAVYEETFPAKLKAALIDFPQAYETFDQVAAVDVLLAIAGAWPTLGRDQTDPRIRYYVRTYPSQPPRVVATFIAIELANDQIVVATIETIPIN